MTAADDDRALARIERALPAVGRDLAPPAGWQNRVLAAGPARRRPWWWIAAPAAALAAAVVLWLVWPRAGQAPRPPTIALDVRRGADVVRGASAAVGDRVRAVGAGGDRSRALWVFRGDELVAACPGDAACAGTDAGWTVEVAAAAVGRYRFVYLTAPGPIAPPDPRYDRALATALGAGARARTELLDVR